MKTKEAKVSPELTSVLANVRNIQLTAGPDTEVIALTEPVEEMVSEKTEWYKCLDVGMKAPTVQTFPIETGELTSQIEEAKKDVPEWVKNWETETIKYASQEIRRCEKNTLNYIQEKVETITVVSLKRRIEVIKDLAENMQQGFDDALCFAMEGLQSYKKETLRVIEENSLKQVEKTATEIEEKANNVTINDLVNLIEKPLNQILKDCRKDAVHALNMLEIILSEYQEPMYNNLELEIEKKSKNEKQRYMKEILNLLEEEIPRHFRDGLNIFYEELKRREEKAVEHLNREAVERGEKVLNRLITEVASSDSRTERYGSFG